MRARVRVRVRVRVRELYLELCLNEGEVQNKPWLEFRVIVQCGCVRW